MASLISVVCSWFVRQVSHVRLHRKGLTLPDVCHLTLDEPVIRNKDILVIGDVHGCYNELVQLLEKANALNNNNALVLFVGDLVNKGPQSQRVVELVRTMENAYAVRGNHDEAALFQLNYLQEHPTYEPPKKYSWMMELKKEDVSYLNSLPYTIEIPSLKALIVHAGLIPGKTLEMQNLNDMTNMRNIVAEDYFHGNGLRGTANIDTGVAWATLWPGPEHVYFGHDARRRLQLHPHATGLDTGCVYGGQLTAAYLTGQKEIISVKGTMYSPP